MRYELIVMESEMRIRTVIFSIISSLLLVIALISVANIQAWAALYKSEGLELNFAGSAFEINPAGDGSLWISDFGGDEIRQVNPATGAYTVYHDIATPRDARPDEAGNLWWTDSNDQLLRLSLSSGQVMSWTLPNSLTPLGTAVDQAENIWVTDSFEPLLFRFNPGTTEICSYAVPDGGTSNYIATDGSDIWLSDYSMSRIIRLEPGSNTFTLWDLPWSSYVNGIGFDDGGDLWFAESWDYSLLARFEPQINQLTAYTLPVGLWPEMLTFQDNRIWYTEDGEGMVGGLDPEVAENVTMTLSVSSAQVSPTCEVLGPGTTTSAVTSSSTADWTTSVITNVVDSQGWEIYQLPTDSEPFGITVVDDQIFVVDVGRQVLIRISIEDVYNVYLPLVVK
jgi:streptogramin lyase